MPTGPKGQKRPADVIGNAVKIARIATGEEEDVVEQRVPQEEVRRLGGLARAASLTPAKRTEIARKASRARIKSKEAEKT